MKRRQTLILTGILCATSILAFFLQDVVRQVILLPLAYIGWMFGLFYRSFPQQILWAVVVVIVMFIFLASLISEDSPGSKKVEKALPTVGAVESLAFTLENSGRGMYARWQVAHRLGKLARDLLILRGDRANAKIFAPLSGRYYQPPGAVGAYLEAGLNGSFADYPQPRGLFPKKRPTPLDIDVSEAVAFLESQMER